MALDEPRDDDRIYRIEGVALPIVVSPRDELLLQAASGLRVDYLPGCGFRLTPHSCLLPG